MKINKEKRQVIAKRVVHKIVELRKTTIEDIKKDKKFIAYCNRNSQYKVLSKLEDEINFVNTLNKKYKDLGLTEPFNIDYSYRYNPRKVLEEKKEFLAYEYLNLKPINQGLLLDTLEEDLILKDGNGKIEELIDSLVELYK